MTDLSFKVWHVAVNCDHPAHNKRDPVCSDYETVEPDETRVGYRADMRAQGWIFHRDGRVTCPDCAKLPKKQRNRPTLLMGE